MYDALSKYLDSFESDEEFYKHKDEYDRLKSMSNRIRRKYSYDQMLYSFKSFKIENWFDSEEIKFLK